MINATVIHLDSQRNSAFVLSDNRKQYAIRNCSAYPHLSAFDHVLIELSSATDSATGFQLARIKSILSISSTATTEIGVVKKMPNVVNHTDGSLMTINGPRIIPLSWMFSSIPIHNKIKSNRVVKLKTINITDHGKFFSYAFPMQTVSEGRLSNLTPTKLVSWYDHLGFGLSRDLSTGMFYKIIRRDKTNFKTPFIGQTIDVLPNLPSPNFNKKVHPASQYTAAYFKVDNACIMNIRLSGIVKSYNRSNGGKIEGADGQTYKYTIPRKYSPNEMDLCLHSGNRVKFTPSVARNNQWVIPKSQAYFPKQKNRTPIAVDIEQISDEKKTELVITELTRAGFSISKRGLCRLDQLVVTNYSAEKLINYTKVFLPTPTKKRMSEFCSGITADEIISSIIISAAIDVEHSVKQIIEHHLDILSSVHSQSQFRPEMIIERYLIQSSNSYVKQRIDKYRSVPHSYVNFRDTAIADLAKSVSTGYRFKSPAFLSVCTIGELPWFLDFLKRLNPIDFGNNHAITAANKYLSFVAHARNSAAHGTSFWQTIIDADTYQHRVATSQRSFVSALRSRWNVSNGTASNNAIVDFMATLEGHIRLCDYRSRNELKDRISLINRADLLKSVAFQNILPHGQSVYGILNSYESNESHDRTLHPLSNPSWLQNY